MHLIHRVFLAFSFSFSGNVFGINSELLPYVYDSSEFFYLESCMYLAALTQEGGEVGVETIHSNGNIDIGPAQISKGGAWEKLFLREYGISSEKIRDNGEINILFGAFILSKELSRNEGDMIFALSSYHRGYGNRKGSLGIRYAKKVISHYRILLQTHECKNNDFRLARNFS